MVAGYVTLFDVLYTGIMTEQSLCGYVALFVVLDTVITTEHSCLLYCMLVSLCILVSGVCSLVCLCVRLLLPFPPQSSAISSSVLVCSSSACTCVWGSPAMRVWDMGCVLALLQPYLNRGNELLVFLTYPSRLLFVCIVCQQLVAM